MAGLAYLLGGRIYDFLDDRFEKVRYARTRKRVLKSLKGKILDAGCGTGRNFQYYNSEAKVVGVDISEKMLEIAKERAAKSKASIEIRTMDLKSMSFKDDSFDYIMASFVLCVMPEEYERRALKELARVAKPDAELYFLEYVYSQNPFRRFVMRATSFIPKILYDIRFDSTLSVVESEKMLKVKKLEFIYDDVVRLIVAQKIKGGKNGSKIE